MVAVEAALSDKVLDLVYPGRMVDQVLERSSRLVDLLEIETVGGPVLVGVDVAVPFSGFQGWNVVEAGVEIGYLIRSEGPGQEQIAEQVEKVDIEIGDHECSLGRRMSMPPSRLTI